MHLKQINLTNVCQFESKTFEFLPGFNLLVGENGKGKTTLLRSIAAVLGPKGARNATSVLSDDDITRYARELSIHADVEQSNESLAVYSYRREWGGRAKRTHLADLPLLLIYGSNEATCSNFVGKRRPREARAGRIESMRYREEEWLYDEMERDFVAEKDTVRFGSSREIRRFVQRILHRFSPNFFDFGWTFEPYRCTIRQKAHGPGDLDPRHKRFLANAILRYFDNRKRPLHLGDERLLVLDSSGHPIGEKRSFRRFVPLPRFEEILRQFGNSDIPSADFKNLVAEVHLTPRIFVETRNGPLLLGQLSDGEKRLFSMFVDIARQLSISGKRRHIEEIPAIVLIDEIDVHLHPKWQRQIVPRLEDLFPSCQFIATTHSPFVVQGVDESHVQRLDDPLMGDFTDRSIEEIVVKVMDIEDNGVSPRYLEMLDAAREYFKLLESAEVDKAKGKRAAVKKAKSKMDALSAPYARNPAYQAFLELNKDLRLGGE